jgi:hypothetical protein
MTADYSFLSEQGWVLQELRGMKKQNFLSWKCPEPGEAVDGFQPHSVLHSTSEEF